MNNYPGFKNALIYASCLLLMACTSSNTDSIQQAQMAYTQQNYSAAFDKTMKLAEAGDMQAQYALGYMYFYGKGTPADQDIGHVWIKRAATQGYGPAIKALQMLDNPNT